MVKENSKAAREARKRVALSNASKPSSPEEQLARLDKRLGNGVGAKRERAKLIKS